MNRPGNNNNRPGTNRPGNGNNNNRPGFNRPGNDNNNRPGTNRPGNGNNKPGFNRPGNGNNRPGINPPGNNRPGFNRPGNNRPGARPDYSKYRRAVTAPRRYSVGRYRAPSGYRYQRWNYGQRLPTAYYASTFWLSNFIAYGLFAPPPDAVWVRYGPDALLVDRYTGEIISVEYGAFY
jgi:Ni/Co efflux regulator RcnB